MADSTDKTDSSAPTAYGDKVAQVGQWAVVALASVGSFAVTKLSFDHLGNGDYSNARWLKAFACLVVFSLGATTLVCVVTWLTRANRISIAYLRQPENPSRRVRLKRWFISNRVRANLEDTPYLLAGYDTVELFETELATLVSLRMASPETFSAKEVRQLGILIDAKKDALDTARADRAARVGSMATPILAIGALMVTLGVAGFGYVTNQATTIQQDSLDQVVPGQLRPAAPSTVDVVVPSTETAAVTDLIGAVGARCKLDRVHAVLVEVATHPGLRVMHVVTIGSSTCKSAEFWAKPDWVVPPSADDPASGSTTTTVG